jgi:hypothetical protein
MDGPLVADVNVLLDHAFHLGAEGRCILNPYVESVNEVVGVIAFEFAAVCEEALHQVTTRPVRFLDLRQRSR